MKALLFVFLLVIVVSCKKDDVQPTGSAKITYTSNQEASGYFLYTESTYGKTPALRNGSMNRVSTNPNVYQLLLEDLNPGTYIVTFSNVNASFVFQITGGREREYSFR